jgi:hypothetical protein
MASRMLPPPLPLLPPLLPLPLPLLLLLLLLAPPTAPQPAPAMQRILPGTPARGRTLAQQASSEALVGEQHKEYLRRQAAEAQTAARYQAALRRNSRGGREAARLAALRALEERPVSVVATLTDGSLLASWALAAGADGEEVVLALSAIRTGAGSAGAGQQQYALPSDVLWLVVTGLRTEHTYTVEINGEEVLTELSSQTLAEGLALRHVSGNGSEWLEGTVGKETYYYRSSEPGKIFWELPDDDDDGVRARDEL